MGEERDPKGLHLPLSEQTDGRPGGYQRPLLYKVKLELQQILNQDGALLGQGLWVWATGDLPDIIEGALAARPSSCLLITSLLLVQIWSRVTSGQTLL